MSDHKCIKVTFDINSNQKGPEYLKLDTLFLKENQFVDGMKQLRRNFDTGNNAHADWDALKSKLKNTQ